MERLGVGGEEGVESKEKPPERLFPFSDGAEEATGCSGNWFINTFRRSGVDGAEYSEGGGYQEEPCEGAF